MMTPAQLKMQRARIALLLEEPFFGSLMLGLKPVEDGPGDVTTTMATDGVKLWWHPKFVNTLSERETGTVLAHEAMHNACLHQLRRGDRDAQAWNVACDHAVNLVLEECNEMARTKGSAEPFPWPECGVLRDTQHVGKSAEEIYVAESGKPDSSGDSPGMGGVLDAPGDEADKQAQEANWKVAMVQAALAAKGCGKLPASLARLVEDQINPQPRWQELLRAFVREAAKDDYAWSKPNYRYSSTGFVLPSLHSRRLGRITVAVDTSGSIDATLLNTFMGEVENICAECRPESVTLIDCDAEVNSIRECDPSDPLPRDFQGGGGTAFEPVMVALENDPPVCLIYLTDLRGSFPDVEPGYPVFWAVHGNDGQAPFGHTVRID